MEQQNKIGTREEWFKGKCQYCGKDITLFIAAPEQFMKHATQRNAIGLCCRPKINLGITGFWEAFSVPDLVRVKSKTWYK